MVTKASVTNVDSTFITNNPKYIKITNVGYPNSLIFLPINTSTSITLTGTGFTSNCVAYINNQAVTTTYISATSISIAVNYATVGAWSLHVKDTVTGISGSYINGFITRNIVGEISYTSAGTYSWVCPSGLDATISVNVVCIGGGGGGSGGGAGLGWKNSIAVTPGTSYTVQVGGGGWPGSAGGDSYFISTATVKGGGGGSGGGLTTTFAAVSGGTYTGGGGGNGGGVPAKTTSTTYGGGGGAGGYAGAGGAAGYSAVGSAGAGGGGGGGGGDLGNAANGEVLTGGGGGTGLYGQGSSGAAGTQGAAGSTWAGGGGNGSVTFGSTVVAAYGGGGGVWYNDAYAGTAGAVRIVWGAGRSFPSTGVGP